MATAEQVDKLKDYPDLQYNIAVNNIKISLDESCYYGVCPDGTETHLGIVGDEQLIEEYLQDYPRPSDW